MSHSVSDLLKELNIRCFDPDTLQSKFHYTVSSLDALDVTEDSHFWSVSKRKLVKHLLQSYMQTKVFSLLDVGCGNGGLLQFLEQQFPAAVLTGMDGYLEALSHCRRRSAGVQLFLQDVTRLSQSDIRITFDVITLMDVLEHLNHPSAVLDELHSFLNPGGIIIATVPASSALWSERDVFLGHRKRYSAKDFTDLFSQSGYNVLHANYVYSYLFLPAYIYRKWIAPLRRMDGESVEASELRIVPVLNEIMKMIGLFEVALTNRVPMPFGTSVYTVARKQ